MNLNLFEEINKFTPKKSRKKGNFAADKFTGEVWLNFSDSGFVIKNKNWLHGFFVIVVFSVLFIFLAKLFDLQVTRGDENLVLADGNSVRVMTNIPERGLLYDRNGDLIIRNIPVFQLEMTTNYCLAKSTGSCKEDLSNLAQFIEFDEERVFSDLNKGFSTLIVETGLTKEEIIPIEINSNMFPSILVSVVPQRDYLYADAFAHLVGYVGFDDTAFVQIVGKNGVELSYDSVLKGTRGGRVVRVDSAGKILEVLTERETLPGTDLKLYLDKGLQNLAYSLLKEKIDTGEATGGAVVAQDPKTGGILALVSYPSFDPNLLSSGISNEKYQDIIDNEGFPFFNRALSATYPPASTFKIIMSAAMLMEEVVGEHYQINDTGSISVAGFTYKGWKQGGHGLVDLRRALQVSNDIYYYVIGGGHSGIKGLGIKKIHDWADKFGLGNLTGIDIPGEAVGFMPSGEERQWYLGDTYITSIGQGDVLATPLQINNVTNYFANGGYLFKPSVVQEIGGNTKDIDILAQNIIDSHSYEVVREGMRLVTLPGGTAYPFFDFPDIYEGVEVAGKTGTAEFGGIDNEDTHAWFTVFGPYDNASISLTVLLESGGGGSDDAAPIARKLFDYWFSL